MTRLTSDTRRLLQQVAYLRDLSEPDFLELSRVSQLRHVEKGACIFEEGAPAAGIFVIVSGRVRLLRTASDGREQVLHEEGPGATLAEVPVFDAGGYVATALATEATALLMVPRATLLRVLAARPASALAVIAVLAGRVRRFARLASELSFKPIVDRLAGHLLRESERTGDQTIMLPDTRDELGSHIGTVREQASRALSQLARAGAIEVRGRAVMIKNRRQLEAFADGGDERTAP